MTPNPSTMKFVADKLLVENGATVEYTDPDQPMDSPLAQRLFNFPFISGIFIASNFITLTKNDLVEWEDIMLEVREYITQYLVSGKAVFNQQPSTTQHASSQEEENFIPLESTPANAREEKIVNILEEYIRPAVEGDGGAIHFKSFEVETGVLTVVLRGACSGCPSSTVTLKQGIQGLFNQMMPEVKEVVAEEL
ncbi:MAG: NifU family protein [Salibacteraceae bacterium]